MTNIWESGSDGDRIMALIAQDVIMSNTSRSLEYGRSCGPRRSRHKLIKVVVMYHTVKKSPQGKNVLYAQSGGVTAVINSSASGVISTIRSMPDNFGKVYAGKNGIIGILKEELIDTSFASDEDIAALKHTPGGAFGSCRYKLTNITESRCEYERLIEVFQAHDIGYFFYNGGGDSQDTAYKVSQLAAQLGYPMQCIGIPKTVDNDLPFTDTCPGFGSVAKYVAVSIKEAGLDVKSMAASSTKVFIMEVMGRHAGWIAAAGGLAAHVILFPEITNGFF